MHLTSDLIQRIETERDGYSKSFRKVSDVVMNRPEKVVYMSIAELSEAAGVSDPTIMRFCRSLGYNGFKEFKVKLAEEAAARSRYSSTATSSMNGSSGYVKRMGALSIAALDEVMNTLDPKDIEEVVELIANASKIEFWGQCSSAAVAQDAYDKFFSAGIPCYVTTDQKMQNMSAKVMSPDNVVVAISHTGRNLELIKNIHEARQRGATVVGITIGNSPVAMECSKTISINFDERQGILTAMILRLAHLLVLDTLAVGVLLKKDESSARKIMGDEL